MIDENEAEPYLTDLAGMIALAMKLTPWVRVPPHRLRTWKEVLLSAKRSSGEFDREVASSCRAALKEFKQRRLHALAPRSK